MCLTKPCTEKAGVVLGICGGGGGVSRYRGERVCSQGGKMRGVDRGLRGGGVGGREHGAGPALLAHPPGSAAQPPPAACMDDTPLCVISKFQVV